MIDIFATIVCVVFGMLGMVFSVIGIIEIVRQRHKVEFLAMLGALVVAICILVISAGMFFIGVAV